MGSVAIVQGKRGERTSRCQGLDLPHGGATDPSGVLEAIVGGITVADVRKITAIKGERAMATHVIGRVHDLAIPCACQDPILISAASSQPHALRIFEISRAIGAIADMRVVGAIQSNGGIGYLEVLQDLRAPDSRLVGGIIETPRLTGKVAEMGKAIGVNGDGGIPTHPRVDVVDVPS